MQRRREKILWSMWDGSVDRLRGSPRFHGGWLSQVEVACSSDSVIGRLSFTQDRPAAAVTACDAEVIPLQQVDGVTVQKSHRCTFSARAAAYSRCRSIPESIFGSICLKAVYMIETRCSPENLPGIDFSVYLGSGSLMSSPL